MPEDIRPVYLLTGGYSDEVGSSLKYLKVTGGKLKHGRR
jgi:hypothetical protein